MPVTAKRPCGTPGCPELVEKGKCGKCRTKANTQDQQYRGTSGQRGYDYMWQQYRERYLHQHPLCAMCQAAGIIEKAEVVDHIIPVTGKDDPRFWDPTNHQALSKRCHSIKTIEDAKQGRTRAPGMVQIRGGE